MTCLALLPWKRQFLSVCVLYRVKCKLLAELCKSRMEHIFLLNCGGGFSTAQVPWGRVGRSRSLTLELEKGKNWMGFSNTELIKGQSRDMRVSSKQGMGFHQHLDDFSLLIYINVEKLHVIMAPFLCKTSSLMCFF